MTMLTDEQKRLVEANVPLARFLAHKRWEMAPGALDYEELVSLAYQGLVSAAQRWRSYSEENGLPEEEIVAGDGFSVFSRKRIIGAILDWQKRDADHVPRSYRTDYKMVQRAGYPDRVKKYSLLSRATGLSVDRIKLVIAAVERMPVSFHEMVDDEGNVTMDEPKARTDVEESVVVASVGNAIVAKISEMSPLQQVTLALRYFEGLEFQDIANELEVSASSVREAHNEALVTIQTAMVEAISH